ncbi:unnamed protein product [Heterobilharzia americana]|nr:unnamed protein product [Heterobilharzia americana]
MTAPCNRFCYSFDNRINIQYTQFPESDCSIRHYNPVCWTAVKKTENNNIKCNHIDDDNDDSLTDCNSNSLTFFNPCFAGCRTRVQDGGVVKKYSDCQCVTPYALNPSGPLNSSSSIAYANISGHHDLFNSSGEVYPGRCKPECSLYGLFLAMLFLHILCTGILQNPSNVITLSCVSSEDGSVALGLQIFFVRTLAYIPAPIYFGQLFDLACQYRSNSVNHHSSPSKLTNYETSTLMNKTQPTSTSFLLLQNSLSTSAIAATTASMSSDQQPIVDNVSGGCLEYNLEGLPFIWLGAVCALKVISLIGSTITYWLAKRQFNLIAKHKEQEQQVSCKDEELIAEKTEIPFQHKVLSDPKSMLSNPSEIGIYGEIYASDNLQEIPV